jgi:L-aspartate oxidase
MNPAAHTVPETIYLSDVLVVGSGTAGLSTALHAVGKAVVVISKTEFGRDGSSYLAQGGVAAALDEADSPQDHAADTLNAGCGLCDPEVVREVTREGPQRIHDLIALGARLDRAPSGDLALGREAAHGRARIAHASGDATGAELMRTLVRATGSSSRISVHEGILAVDLIIDRGRAIGVVAVNRDGRRVLFLAGAVVLATGGIGRVFQHSTNPEEATGDGLAMAARAGARLAGVEFVQFHPTALADGSEPMALLTEALRGEGAILVDGEGSRFLPAVHPQAELAPRDVVARANWRHLRDFGDVYLDARHLGDRLPTRFPTVVGLCAERGLDPAVTPIPVAPAAHYHMGGVVVDRWGRTSVDSLWACGEVAFTGLHGANRLASNSLLEALVYGRRVGCALADRPSILGGPRRFSESLSRVCPDLDRRAWLAEDDRAAQATELRELMWQYVGVERSEAGLSRAEHELEQMANELGDRPGELQNLIAVASLVTRGARLRTESRGAHHRIDLPRTDAHWRQDLIFDGMRPMAPRPMTEIGSAAG